MHRPFRPVLAVALKNSNQTFVKKNFVQQRFEKRKVKKKTTKNLCETLKAEEHR